MHISHKEWICQVSEERLAEKIAEARSPCFKNNSNFRGAVTDPLWRQVEVTLREDGINLRLMSVGEVTARGGYFSVGYGCRDFNIRWEDLDDVEFIEKLGAPEKHRAAQRLIKLLGELRENRLVFRQALNCLFGDSPVLRIPS